MISKITRRLRQQSTAQWLFLAVSCKTKGILSAEVIWMLWRIRFFFFCFFNELTSYIHIHIFFKGIRIFGRPWSSKSRTLDKLHKNNSCATKREVQNAGVWLTKWKFSECFSSFHSWRTDTDNNKAQETFPTS